MYPAGRCRHLETAPLAKCAAHELNVCGRPFTLSMQSRGLSRRRLLRLEILARLKLSVAGLHTGDRRGPIRAGSDGA